MRSATTGEPTPNWEYLVIVNQQAELLEWIVAHYNLGSTYPRTTKVSQPNQKEEFSKIYESRDPSITLGNRDISMGCVGGLNQDAKKLERKYKELAVEVKYLKLHSLESKDERKIGQGCLGHPWFLISLKKNFPFIK